MSRTTIELSDWRWFDFTDPRPEDIHIEDVARSLSNACRFGGHVKRRVSVAEHALFVCRLVRREFGRPDLAAAALHHDSHEAFVGDVPTPLKTAIGDVYRDMGAEIDQAIGPAFGVRVADFTDPVVKQADELALRIEAAHCKTSRGVAGAWPYRELPRMRFPMIHRIGSRFPLIARLRFRAAHARECG